MKRGFMSLLLAILLLLGAIGISMAVDGGDMGGSSGSQDSTAPSGDMNTPGMMNTPEGGTGGSGGSGGGNY